MTAQIINLASLECAYSCPMTGMQHLPLGVLKIDEMY